MQVFETPMRLDNMALIYQEVLTVVMRLRTGRQQVSNTVIFRNQMRNALKMAETEGLRGSYSLEDLKMGAFAVVAFLDESIDAIKDPIFADWQRKPLQEELFGMQAAGEVFFRNAERLLARPSSPVLADVLEVYELCLLLGFHGRYRAGGTKPEIRGIVAQIQEKIQGIRGERLTLEWRPQPADLRRKRRSKWTPVLRWTAIGAAGLALLLFTIFKILLTLNTIELKTLARGVTF